MQASFLLNMVDGISLYFVFFYFIQFFTDRPNLGVLRPQRHQEAQHLIYLYLFSSSNINWPIEL